MADLREDLARALMDADEKWRGLPWSGLSPRVQKLFLRDADAAIALLWPRAMEMAAGVLIAHQREVDDDNSYWGGPHKRHYDTPRELATAIRNLEPPK